MNLPVEATGRDGHRENRNLPGQVVKLHEIKQFTSEARALACLYATYLMGWNQERSKKEKLIIADAATTLVAYDLGYKRRIGKYGLEEWLKKIEASVLNTSANGIFHSKHKGMESQTKRVEAEHPTYLHSLYRRATMILGDAATFTEIASQMNLLSAVDERPTMNLNKWSLLRWFKTKKGKEKRTVFRPLLTPQHKINRVQHAHRIRTLMDQGAAICYLDEKWFYLVSRRKTSKYLPRAEFEAEGADRIRVRRVISRSYPVKTMFMGVIAQPNAERNFSGLVSMKRLSEQQELQRGTYRTRFHLDHHINRLIVEGSWRQIYDDPTYTIAELSQLMVEFFHLDDDIAEALCFRYETQVGGQRRMVELLANETLEGKIVRTLQGERELTIDDVDLSCYYPQGTIVEREVNCNSQFMLRILPEIAREIRQSYHWMPPNERIYLVMDNAGGHGTREAREQYTRQLLEDFNIEIIQQSARSPEVNALDLGIWMSVQSYAECRHRERRRDPDGLAVSVMEAWENLPVDTIQKVFNRIPIVLQLIVEGGGDNINVEERRGRQGAAVVAAHLPG